jgi:Uma2 family endonuclease
MSLAQATPAAAIAIPHAPSAEVWLAWSPAKREAFLEEARAALLAEARLSPEGRPHQAAKARARDALLRWFSTQGRHIYLGSEEMVIHPLGEAFCPDLFAVLDVPDPGPDADRTAWVVAEEKRGVDLVLEVLYRGDRRKDLVDNVTFYAALGIREYFVYDIPRQAVYGWRLPEGGPRRYQSIPREVDTLASAVLGLELTAAGGRLRFRAGSAELPEVQELLERANRLLDRQVSRAEAEGARVEEAERRAAEAEARAAAETEARIAAEARIAELTAALAALRRPAD